jgi:tetratricopeptide (TPR) repeat protein
MIDTIGARKGIRVYLQAMFRLAYTTLCYLMVGLTPEEYHWAKGATWARLRAYRLGAHHFRKLLMYSESAPARVWLGWCYGNLGMSEAAAQHLRQAYSQRPHPETALFLAQEELRLGKPERARELLIAVEARRLELNDEQLAELKVVEGRLAGGDLETANYPANRGNAV